MAMNYYAALPPDILLQKTSGVLGVSSYLNKLQSDIGYIISQLFSNSEQGFTQTPSDLSTLYQDAAGTTPVTGAGQVLGLVLDKSKGLVLGSNIVTDSGFDNPAKWAVVTTGFSVSGGLLIANNAGAGNKIQQTTPDFPFVPNKYYEITYTCAEWTSGEFGVFIGQSSFKANRTGTGTFTERVLAGTNTSAGLWIRANTTLTAKFDNITVREVLGNHAYQSTSSYRPLLQDSPRRVVFDGIDDKLTTTLAAQLTGCTVIRAIPNVGCQILTNQTIPTPYNDSTNHCGLIVINRALTAYETSLATQIFNKLAGV
ncbi:hypothetical protein [Acinetobacter sp. ANC 4640]